MTLTMPWMWCSGRVRRIRSSCSHSQASTSDLIWASMLAWVVTTPLGRPVVPLVNRIMARRLGIDLWQRHRVLGQLVDEEELDPSCLGQGAEQLGIIPARR